MSEYVLKLNTDFKLKFDYYYKASIEKQIKQGTIRLCTSQTVRIAEVIECEYNNANDTETFYIQIKDINSIKFCELRHHDALLEGYLEVGLLKQVLKSFYPDITCDTCLDQYRFKYLGVKEDLNRKNIILQK